MSNTVYSLVPGQGVNNVCFNEPRETVRQKLGGYKEFKKSRFSKNTSDMFSSLCVFYTDDNKAREIEFYHGTQLMFRGKDLFQLSAEELMALFEKDGAIRDHADITVEKLGIYITLCPDGTDCILIR